MPSQVNRPNTPRRRLTPKKKALRSIKKDAALVQNYIELGDQRLLAMDGPAGGQIPDLSPHEWGVVYRACKRISRAVEVL